MYTFSLLLVQKVGLVSMNRPNYEESYRRFRAFVECTGTDATTYKVGTCGVSLSPAGTPYYTRAGADLSLCAQCIHFWRECAEHGDLTTWEIAVYLRDLRVRDADKGQI